MLLKQNKELSEIARKIRDPEKKKSARTVDE